MLQTRSENDSAFSVGRFYCRQKTLAQKISTFSKKCKGFFPNEWINKLMTY